MSKVVDLTSKKLEQKAYEHVSTGQSYAVYTPPKNMWECSLSGSWSFRVQSTSAPCWFHRVMQRLCLGILWRKVK